MSLEQEYGEQIGVALATLEAAVTDYVDRGGNLSLLSGFNQELQSTYQMINEMVGAKPSLSRLPREPEDAVYILINRVGASLWNAASGTGKLRQRREAVEEGIDQVSRIAASLTETKIETQRGGRRRQAAGRRRRY